MQILLPALLISLLTMVGHAQTTMQMPHTTAPATSDAQKIFEKMKSLAGSWLGNMSTTPQVAGTEGKLVQIALRVTSRGNALMHEMKVPTRPDDPITMFYVDNGQLTLTHYCDAGNRPRMTGAISPDGNRIEFEFLDVAGPVKYGHMHHTVFTFVDADHHVEEWTYMAPTGKPVNARFELTRSK